MVCFKRYIIIVALSMASLTLTTLHAAPPAPKQGFCGTAVDKDLCEKTVKGAKTWDDAITAATTQLATATKSGDPQCKDFYKSTDDKLKECMKLAKSGDKDGSLNVKLTAASTSISDCSGVVKDPAKKKVNTAVDQAIKVCLAV
ncbi:PREDICTED: uncharacterized protein LOC109179528 [Ipomoea nil]|uniref:uncharacterized protein LOC109179528 n=1 Tax=Ipomoea nil TaxID=35883 RepID=UPI0009018106|nr:PREDICTED: uncharacterized protein LOC109179528 [Ipomoea nil]